MVNVGMDSNSRNYLIKIPIEWYAKPKIFSADKISKYITFLNELPGEISAVYTKIIYEYESIARNCAPRITYNYSRKKVSIEINGSTFNDKLKMRDPSRKQIEKDRYILDTCYLDVYKTRLLGLAILKSKIKKNPIPIYLKAIKEITKDERYSTYHLATLNSINLLV
jgi:hypothetical protein